MAIRASKWVQSGWIQPEWIAAFTLIVFPFLEGFTGTGEAIVEAPDYRASIDRLKQTEKMGIGEGGQTHVLSPAHRIDHRDADDAPWQQGGRLSLDRVSFRYSKDEELAVDNVSLTIPSGMKMAIIGQSGSGKSTLFKLIQGELPVNSGGITLDGHSTFEITQQHESIPVFSVLNQQPYLFDTTIENNIRLAHPEATEQEVQSAVEMAGLGELVAGLPKGLRTRVHESGLRFSGGERQRIALARILLQNTPIVLLDEPTVGLDPIVENRLIDTIFTALRGKTLIWITHHLRFLERMDQIVFFENGRVLMQGSHDQLLRSNNRYRQLYELDM